MPLSPIAASLLATMPPLKTDNVEESRRLFREGSRNLIELIPAPEVQAESIEVPTRYGLRAVRRYIPSETTYPHPIVYFPGGGFVLGDPDTHHALTARLCHTLGAIVLSVDYAKAPEAKFPQAVYECYDVAVWASHRASAWNVAQEIVVAGDSAGGNLAAVVAQLARDANAPSILAQVLYYPATDMSQETSSRRDFAQGYFLTEAAIQWFGTQYLNDSGDALNPMASPLLHPDLANLPPALILTGEYDPLRDEGESYADRLARSGVTVKQIRYDGMIHGFMSMPLFPELQAGLEETKAFLTAVHTVGKA